MRVDKHYRWITLEKIVAIKRGKEKRGEEKGKKKEKKKNKKEEEKKKKENTMRLVVA